VIHTLAMPVEFRVVVELATAQEVETGMARVVALLRHAFAAARVEWWAPGEGDRLRLVAWDGAGRGEGRRFPLGLAGEVVVVGRCDPRLASALAAVAPILRRRCVEERLVCAATKLARRNDALEEFAALVAHELKTPLQAALVADDAASEVERALELVDSLLEVTRDTRESPSASAAACLEQALHDLGAVALEVTAGPTADLPLPPASLRVILRNLLRNAVAAGARCVHVVAVRSTCSSRLLVLDDGVGVGAAGGYATGSGLGLSLCRAIARRYGGVLELAPRPTGGTRATLQLRETS
jgi:signal transduction histidine kinase